MVGRFLEPFGSGLVVHPSASPVAVHHGRRVHRFQVALQSREGEEGVRREREEEEERERERYHIVLVHVFVSKRIIHVQTRSEDVNMRSGGT